MPQFHVLPEDVKPESFTATIRGGEARHLARVLRVGVGVEIAIFDGEGNRWSGVTQTVTEEQVGLVRLSALPDREPPCQIHLIQGLIKGERWEWLLEKAVELGATRISPVFSEFTVVKRAVVKNDKKTRDSKRSKWRARALAAAKQCGRGLIPPVDEPVALTQLLRTLGAPADGEKRVAAHVGSGEGWAMPADTALIRVAIGPEGGWSSDDLKLLEGAGFCVAGLGPRTLRSETAAAAALTLCSTLVQKPIT